MSGEWTFYLSCYRGWRRRVERERERTTCTKVRRVHKAGIPGGGSKEEDYGEQRPRFPHVRLMDAYAGRL